jgi:hypothetical protein
VQLDVDFEPFAGDPLILAPAAKSVSHKGLILLIPAIVFAILAIIQLIFLDHAEGSFAGYLCADLRAFVAIGPANSGGCHRAPSMQIPLRRDFATFLAATILTLTPLLTWKMWDGYGRLISHMTARGSIIIDNADIKNFKLEILIANRDVKRIGRFAGLTMLLMGVALSQLMAQQGHDGVFSFLRPTTSPPSWSLAAYSGWWASDQHPYGHILYFVIGSWGLYLLTQQNLVGLRLILLLWRSRKVISFGADPINADGYYGWSAVRQSLGAVYTMLALHGVALVCVIRMMPTSTIVGPVAVAWLQWIVVLPLYLAFPFFFVRRKIANYKKVELGRLSASAASIASTLPEHERIAAEDAIAARMGTIRSVPTLPFKSLQDSSIFLISMTADVAAVIGIIISYMNAN